MTTEMKSYVREVDGREVPIAGTWTIDPTHTTVDFVARHLMVTKVRGRFSDVSGTVEVAEDPTQSKVEVVVQLASVSTGAEDRDNHLKSADFFDIENYPTMTYRAESVTRTPDGWRLDGELTIRDVTKPLPLDFEFLGVHVDPWGNPKAAFSASGELEREAWGITWNVPLEGGGVLVSKKVKIEIEVQAALATGE